MTDDVWEVTVDGEGDYTVWPRDRPLAQDRWRTAYAGTREACLDRIATLGADGRPPVDLCEVSRAEVTAILADDRRSQWAGDYPDRGGVVAATMLGRAFDAGVDLDGFGMYQIVRLVDDVVVGNIGFHGSPDDGTAEIGFDLAASCRGRGYATAALRQLSAWALTRTEVCRVLTRTDEENVPSQRVIDRAGFVERLPRDGLRRYTLPAATT